MEKLKTIGRGAAAGMLAALVAAPAFARDQIHIVGSSTVFPFSAAVAERFGRDTSFKTPVVESTGSGGGLKLFCAGVGVQHPDVTNSSRRIKSKELKNCFANGVSDVVEVKIGFDGIAVANARDAADYSLSREILYLALAKEIPQNGSVIPNPHKRWSDVDPSLPVAAIEVLGPPPTSGTRDAFEELALQAGCKKSGAVTLGINCRKAEIRNDGPWVDAGENDNLIVSKLTANPNAVGVFGYSFLDQNSDSIKGAAVGGVLPAFGDIASGAYPLSRSLYFYVKKSHVGEVPGLKEYVAHFIAEDAVGQDGYLLDKGLIPLTPPEFAAVSSSVNALRAMREQDLM